MLKKRNLLFFEGILVVISFFYFLFFANKGLVFFDEGYYVHAAERIFSGQVPYKDFFLQYGPSYFYILSFLYKIFGPSIIAGRFLSLTFCVLTIITAFLILNKMRVKSRLRIFLVFLSLVSFGYPLINIPNLPWANVLLAFLLVLAYLYWLSQKSGKQFLSAIVIGILLALSVSFKQNFGLAFIILFNFLIIFGKKLNLATLKNLALMQLGWIVIVLTGMYYFFLNNNLQGLFEFINFSKRFASNTAFTYPPLTLIFQPTGVFKLLPYYLPVILLLVVVVFLFRKYRDWKVIAFSAVAIVGFSVSVYPQSDLIHTYPFLGMVLVSFLLLPFKKRLNFAVLGLILITILLGFYLTFFTGSYYYGKHYSEFNTYLNLPRTKGILTTKAVADNAMGLSKFMDTHTSKNDYILAYPYCPLLYFILERPNPSKDLLYFLPDWHFYPDSVILSEMKAKKVKYIVVNDNYFYQTALSEFIQKQNPVFTNEGYKVFEVKQY